MDMPLQEARSTLDEFVRLRRAVYTALLPFFDNAKLMYGMWLWEEQYATEHDKSLRRFVSELCQGELRKRSNTLFFSLMDLLQDPAAKLEEDPYPLMLAYRNGKMAVKQAPVAHAPRIEPAMMVFNTVVNTFMQRLSNDERYYALKVREYVGSVMTDFCRDLRVEQVNELRKWLLYREGELSLFYHREQMAAVVNLLYVGACEFFGPTKVDDYLASAIAEAERLEEARQFPPNSLL